MVAGVVWCTVFNDMSGFHLSLWTRSQVKIQDDINTHHMSHRKMYSPIYQGIPLVMFVILSQTFIITFASFASEKHVWSTLTNQIIIRWYCRKMAPLFSGSNIFFKMSDQMCRDIFVLELVNNDREEKYRWGCAMKPFYRIPHWNIWPRAVFLSLS